MGFFGSGGVGSPSHLIVERLLRALGTHSAPLHVPYKSPTEAMLGVASERALGAHTYFVPIEHTVRARSLLGPEPVLAVEQTAIASADPAKARGIARSWAAHYLELPNYANNWRRLGYGDDLGDGGSDRLIDAAIAWGDVTSIAGRVREHLDAGADHVCVQVISGRDDDVCLPALREIAAALIRRPR